MTGRATALLSALAATATLLTVALCNGQPFLYFDTPGYVDSGRNLLTLVVDGPPPAERPMASRSPWYGLLVYGAVTTTGSLWPVVVVHALVAVWLIWLALRLTAPRAAPWALTLTAVLLLATPAGFTVGFAMPDAFAAYAILGLALLVCGWTALRRAERAGLALLVGFAALAHNGHLAMLLALGPAALLLRWVVLGRHGLGPPAIALSVSLAGAIVLQAGLLAVQSQAYGGPPIRIPFLLARAVADGPGERLLRDACAADPSRYAACRHLDSLPAASADAFLWGGPGEPGVFLETTMAERLALADEQVEIYLASWLAEPAAMLRQLLANARTQFRLVHPGEFMLDANLRDSLESRLPALAARVDDSRFRRFGPADESLAQLARASMYASGAAVLVLVPLLWRRQRQYVLLALVVVAGLVANAVVFGGLSEPHPRYQARVAWLLPVVAVALALAATTRPRAAG